MHLQPVKNISNVAPTLQLTLRPGIRGCLGCRRGRVGVDNVRKSQCRHQTAIVAGHGLHEKIGLRWMHPHDSICNIGVSGFVVSQGNWIKWFALDFWPAFSIDPAMSPRYLRKKQRAGAGTKQTRDAAATSLLWLANRVLPKHRQTECREQLTCLRLPLLRGFSSFLGAGYDDKSC